MNAIALTLLIVSAIGVLALPRRWAPLPLLACCCYMTSGQGIEIGPLSFTIYRLILGLGVVRVLFRREWVPGGLNAIDKLVLVCGGWLVFASLFHEWAPGYGPIFISGVVFNITLVYFLFRAWCTELSDLTGLIRTVCWLLVPVAMAMVAEHVIQKNLFSMFGGMPEAVPIRGGKIRAQGPFQHAILAGIVGAVCVPLAIGIWRKHKISALVGMAASTTMIIASTSSTPLMSLVVGVGGVTMWKFRRLMPMVRWAALGAYICAGILMSRPAYYLISKIDFTGSSTGWYRARLIQSAFEHFSEWWIFGTDDTGAWMYPNIDPKRSDITNYYLYFGIFGGLLATVLLIAIIWRAFLFVGRGIRDTSPVPNEYRFMLWCLGSALFAHALSSLAVAYYDQSQLFFWLNVAAISAIYSIADVRIEAQRSPGIAVTRSARGRGTAGRGTAAGRSRTTRSETAFDAQ